jgi:hypothetical protein
LPDNIQLQTEQVGAPDFIRRAKRAKRREYKLMSPLREHILIRRMTGTHKIKWKPAKKYPAKSNGKKILQERDNQQISEHK